MNWKELFDEDRLNRGYNYYLENRVYDVIFTENSITSKVEGSRSKTYEVKINFDKNSISSLYCTCPYSYADFNCKHMVATLYKMEEINNSTKSNILNNTKSTELLFTQLINSIDENKLRRYLLEKYLEDKDFVEKFIDTFQNEFTPEDFYDYENMLENIFNIDIVELYNENGFFQEAPFQKYLENFINTKISSLFKNNEYDYVLQLIYIIYENISNKSNVTQYIEIDKILESCNYFLEKIIDSQDSEDNEEIFNYLINKISYEYDSKITKYLLKLAVNKFNSKLYLKQLENSLDNIMKEKDNIPQDIILAKYDIIKLLDYPTDSLYSFLIKYRSYDKILKLLVDYEIENKNITNAINYLEEKKDIYNKFSFEDSLTLYTLYKLNDDKDKAIEELKGIIYDFNIKDLFFIKELKEILSNEEWIIEKEKLITFYSENYSYEFLNKIYVEENDIDNLFKNITENCRTESIEEYKEYLKDKYNDEIISIYYNKVLEDARNAKNISTYTIVIKYLDLMTNYCNSSDKVKQLIKVLKKKYKQRKLFMEKIDEFEVLHSLI